MRLVYEGKTKTVYDLEDGTYLLKFKDDATGSDGKFDPGGNAVGLSIAGMGNASLRMTKFFYEKIEAAGIATHYIRADIENSTMTVKPAEAFGNGLEVICRFRAVGSFLRRYGSCAKEGQELNGLVEVTLKDDERQDPLITKDALAALGLLQEEEYELLKGMAKKICGIVKEELAKKGAELYDIKIEFGRAGGKILLMDEISASSMRAYKDGRQLGPMELAGIMFA